MPYRSDYDPLRNSTASANPAGVEAQQPGAIQKPAVDVFGVVVT